MADADLSSRAAVLVQWATDFLREGVGASFDSAVSVGLLGSFARGNPSPTSDVDYYAIIDADAGDKSIEVFGQTVEQIPHRISVAHSKEVLAHRFSIYWTSLEDLQGKRQTLGRFPAYDRALLKRWSKDIAGFQLAREALPEVSIEELQADSLKFLLEEVKPRLSRLGLFSKEPLSAEMLETWNEALLPKVVLMPVRLIYLISSASARQPLVSTEDAARSFLQDNRNASFAGLVDAAGVWRHDPPHSNEPLREAAELLNQHARQLYSHLLTRYEEASRDWASNEQLTSLRSWHGEISRSSNSET